MLRVLLCALVLGFSFPVSAQCLTNATDAPRSVVNHEVASSCVIAQKWYANIKLLGPEGIDRTRKVWFWTCVVDWESYNSKIPDEVLKTCHDWSQLPATVALPRRVPTPLTFEGDKSAMAIFRMYVDALDLVNKGWPNATEVQLQTAASCLVDHMRHFGPEAPEAKEALASTCGSLAKLL